MRTHNIIQHVKQSAGDTNTTAPRKSGAPEGPAGAARSEEACRPRPERYATDKWIIGMHHRIACSAPVHKLPALLIKRFVGPCVPIVMPTTPTYDRNQFVLVDMLDYDDAAGSHDYVRINSHRMRDAVADITFEEDGFVVHVFTKPSSGVYPFTQEDFCKAVNAAKWTLDLFLLPGLDGDAEAGSPTG